MNMVKVKLQPFIRFFTLVPAAGLLVYYLVNPAEFGVLDIFIVAVYAMIIVYAFSYAIIIREECIEVSSLFPFMNSTIAWNDIIELKQHKNNYNLVYRSPASKKQESLQIDIINKELYPLLQAELARRGMLKS